MRNDPVHRSIIAVDIEKFGRGDRTDRVLAELRRRLDESLVSALSGRLDPSRFTLSDTGDGKLCLIDTEHVVRVLDVVDDLEQLVTRDNRELANERTRLRLRVVVHAGPVVPDESGVSGHAVIVAFRLLDSQQLRQCLRGSPGDLVLMVSDQIYDQVISPGHWVRYPASRFDRVAVRNKETAVRAWVLRHPALPPPQPPPLRGLEAVRAATLATWSWLRAAAVRAARWLRPRRRLVVTVTAAVVALAVAAVAVLVAGRDAAPGGGGRQAPVAQGCPGPLVLPVLTGPAMESTVRTLATMFQDATRAPCRTGSIEVFPAPSSSEAVNVLAVDWTRDALAQLGPRPSVWLPDSSVEVERVNALLGAGDRKLAPLGSIATAPVVLAVQRSVMERLRLERSVSWDTMLRWGRRPAGDPRALRIVRGDPTSSSAALLATIGLETDPARAARRSEQSLHAVEQALDRPVGDELGELCNGRQMAGSGDGPPRAVLVPEQAVFATNHGAPGGPCGTSPPPEPQRLEAIYPADGTPVLDYPYVLLPAASQLPARERLARDFFAFLRSPQAQQTLLQAGFRDQSYRVAPTIGTEDGILPSRPRPMDLPRGPTVGADLSAWDRARLPVSALLAIDVSGSMKETFQGPGGTRISTARSAATQAVKLIGDRDRIGLMRFSTRLDGARDYQDLVQLGPAAARRGRVQDQLRRLQPTSGDTGLYDTLLAGIQRLRSGSAGGADAVRALIVVTGGENDDPAGGAAVDDVLAGLDDGDQVLVFLLTLGPVRCDAGELRELDDHQDVHCLDADRLGLDVAFDQVSAALWGTSRAGAGS
jgi:hypothetical protein